VPILIEYIIPIRDQATTGDECASEVDFGQFVTGRECNAQLAMNRRKCASGHDQTAIGRPCEVRDVALDLAGIVCA